jgi:alpha-D-ribose 1-methylphosphonate 5-triphosphate synthase subunit PhnL
MAEPIEDKVIRSLKAAEELYHRLVLIVGKSGTGKTSVIKNLAKLHKTDPININLRLSKELLELTEKQRQLKLSQMLAQAVGDAGKKVFLDNIEILFDVELKQDPLRLLQGLSRNITVVASWNGTFDSGKLIYAEPGHREYRSYDAKDILIVSMNGE